MNVFDNNEPTNNTPIYDANDALLSLSKAIIQNKNNIDTIQLMSFLSLIFKEKFNTDEPVQILEVNFLRENGFKITNFASIVDIIDDIANKENKDEKEICEIFKYLFKEIDNMLSNNQEIDERQFLENVKQIIQNCEQLIQNYLSNNNIKQMTIPVERKRYTLTPTGGISCLNNNPYEFFVSKVLHLSPINEWKNNIDAQTYGNLIHKIAQEYAVQCKDLPFLPKQKINKEIYTKQYIKKYQELFDEVCNRQNINFNAFIMKKIENIKPIIVNLEIESAVNHRFVMVEKDYSTIINGVNVYAKADRVEINYDNKEIYVYDFKTGTLPSNADEINGAKTQLLIIAMLILENQKYKDFHIKQMTYIDLSGKHNARNVVINNDGLMEIKNNVLQQISYYFDNGEPNENVLQYIKPTGLLYEQNYATMQLHREEFIK